MENPFKQIEPVDVLPDHVKKNVIGSIESIAAVMECLELFSSHAATSLSKAMFDYPNEIKDGKEENQA